MVRSVRPLKAPCRIRAKFGTVPNRLAREHSARLHRPVPHILNSSREIKHFRALSRRTKFGRAGALYQDMMPHLIETLEQTPRPQCTGEKARELLESLRTAYQSLSLGERSLVKGVIGRAWHTQVMQESQERECFESVS